MIFKVSHDTPMLHLELSEYGCNGRTLLSGVELHITPIRCEGGKRYIMRHNGCSFERVELPDDRPRLMYPAHDVDDDGRIVFYFDDKFFNLPRGRYLGTLCIPDCNPVTIQLENTCTPLRVRSVAVTHKQGDSLC